MICASFLREAAGRPFVWGHFDCCLFAADWVRRRHLVDPAAAFRGRYGSERGAARFIARAGGLDRLVGGAMAAHGFAETQAPQPGDVGVIDVAGRIVTAIRTARAWACKGPHGLVVTEASSIRGAWSI